MGKYIKLFDYHSEYEAFTATTAFVVPNVSSCKDSVRIVHYNPRGGCPPSDTFEVIGTPSYPSTINGGDTSFNITINYEETVITSSCVETVTEGTDVVSVECGANPSTSSTRTVSGSITWHGIEISYSLTQNKAQQSISEAVVSCNSATYNGSVQTAQNIVVTLRGNTLVENTDYIVTENVGGTNVGNYSVIVSGMGNYSGTSNGTFVIGKVTPTVVAPTAKVLTYNGSAQQLVNAGSTNFGTLKYSLNNSTWSTSIPTATNYGSYTVYYKVDGDSNVNSVAAQSVACSINEKQVTATVILSQSAYTYNGSPCQPTVTVKDGSTVIPSSEYTVTYSNNVNAGTATVTISDNVGGNYEVIGSATFTINKANSSLSFAVSELTVGVGETKSNVVTVNAGDGVVTYSSNNTSIATVDNSGNVTGVSIGNTTVSANISSTSNYNSASASYSAICKVKVAVVTKFNVTDTSQPTVLGNNVYYMSGFSEIEVDGVMQPSVTTGYTFSTTGEHTVKYYLKYPTTITSNAFYHVSSLTSVTIPNSVTSIDYGAFNSCNGITSIDIPNSVTSIGNYAFYQCSGLTSCTIGSGVTSIGSEAFYQCSGLTSIAIPNSVTSIGNGAFNSCRNLRSCTIGSGVTSIGNNAFNGCSGITSIDIPNSVTSIGNQAFRGCNGLRSCTIGSGVTSIGQNAFYGCSGITSIIIPDGVTIIGNGAFQSCRNLRSCTIGSGVTSMGDNAFSDCSSLTSIDIPSGITSIGVSTFSSCGSLTSCTIPSGVTSIGQYAFNQCYGLTSIDIPSGVTSIGVNTFSSCGSLTSINIPINVTSIGNNAFSRCSGLTSVTVEATTPPTLGSDAFYRTNNCPIYVPCESVDTYKAASGWSSYASRIDAIQGSCPSYVTATFNVTDTSSPTRIASATTNFSKIEIDDVEQPSVVSAYTFNTLGEHTVKYYLIGTSITSSAFRGCSGLTSCTIGSGVTSIGNSAFYNCSGLTSIDIPNSVTSIDRYAFYGCSGLTSIDIPSGVTSISDSSLAQCLSLTSVTIPKSVTIIGANAFGSCHGLTSIDIPSGVTSIGQNAFNGCMGLTSIGAVGSGASIEIPSGITSISQGVFTYCTSLTSVTIPNSITSIGDSAFYKCSGLTSINIPNSVTSIGNKTFQDCKGLTSCTIGSGVTSIGDMAFSYCFGLTSIAIPNSVTSIGESAFYACSGLTSCTIGSGVTSIGAEAFRGCYVLTSITCNATTAPTIQSNTFREVKTNGTLTVPSGSSGYNTWMQNSNYYLGLYNWTKVEQ